jgi:protocatechuate 3,4-dioxygenase beta subunit
MPMRSNITKGNARRRALLAGATCAASLCLGRSAAVFADELKPTRACADDHDATPRQMEGPFFKRRSPERTSLLDGGVQGTRIVVSGLVLSTQCRPMAGALLDFWQCNAQGDYDNRGNTLRGHQFTDAQGRYRLETIVPGVYPGRTRHIHVKVQAPNQPILTTQLYFPNEPQNAQDFLYQPELLITLADGQGRFDFVVKVVA